LVKRAGFFLILPHRGIRKRSSVHVGQAESTQSVLSLETRKASGIPRDAAFTKPRKEVPRLPHGFACHRTKKKFCIYLRLI